MASTEQPSPTQYPAVLQQLEEHDSGYRNGIRFRIRTADDEKYCFTTRERADTFVRSHGILLLSEEEMKKYKQQQAQEKGDNDQKQLE